MVPVRHRFDGNFIISDITSKAKVKITDIEVNIVHEYISEGGTIDGETYAFGRYKVANYIYMFFILPITQRIRC